ncbi:hypothetical protein LOZ58_000509 [Ophidiomyces ophidiicola]|nr:hypothetical protein LOZ58_000509 [Ophidiomyces ophidiicola]
MINYVPMELEADALPTNADDSMKEDSQKFNTKPNTRRKIKAWFKNIGHSPLTLLLLWCLLSTALFSITAWIAQAKFSTSSTLTWLRTSQGLLSTCSTIALAKVFELIQWALTGRNGGLYLLSLLGLSPTTGAWGATQIVFAKGARIFDRLWPALRLFLTAAVWLSGVLLFANTSLATGYDALYSYNVTAGVGQFNGSFVEPYLQKLQNLTPEYPYRIISYTTLSTAYNLVVNPMHSVIIPPISCKEDGCDSYLLSGGLVMTTPWPPTDHPSHPVIQIYNVPSTQIEFRRNIDEGESFLNDDCTMFGDQSSLIGIKLCLAHSRKVNGSVIAGKYRSNTPIKHTAKQLLALYVCPRGIQDGQCNGTNLPNLKTTFTIYSCTANIAASRSNYSIVSVSELRDPILTTGIDLIGLKAALSWLLDFNMAAIPPSSSIAGHFWSGQQQLSNQYWSRELYQTFQSILTFPLWKFNPNNFGNVELSAQEITPSLPLEFYTKAAIATPYTRIKLNISMFIAFLVLESVVLSFIWAVFLWLLISRQNLPEITSYPLFDFAFKTKYTVPPRASSLQDVNKPPKHLLRTNDGKILSVLNGLEFFLRGNQLASPPFETIDSVFFGESAREEPNSRHDEALLSENEDSRLVQEHTVEPSTLPSNHSIHSLNTD